jgi:predicted phage terminase large subunit-like protein
MTKESSLSNPVTIEDVKDACRGDLHFLCTEMLGYKDWDICHDEMEIFLARPSAKKALLWPRGHLKTSNGTIGKTIQYILKNPNVRVLIANQVWDMSRKMLMEIKGHLTMSQLPKLFGEFQSEQWNQDSITIRQRNHSFKEPTILTTGIEAETTGGHFDVIFLDDLTGHQNCQTPEQREKTKRFRRSMVNLLEPGGTLIEIGTRWHLDDTFSEIFEREKEYYDILIRQVVENGKIIFPKKFNMRFDPKNKTWTHVDYPCMDYIEHLRKSMTPAEYSAQYLNNPVDEENQLFKPTYFKTWTQRPPRLFVSMTIDPAISEKSSADFFAINVSGMDEKYDIYVLDTLRGHWNVSEAINNIFSMYQKWQPSVIGMETISFQKAIKAWLENSMRERGVHFPVTELKRNTNESKEFRIKALEPFYREGKIYHAPWMKNLELELSCFPKGKHDDEIDAFASQLDLLVPGDTESSQGVPVGSWEAAFQAARTNLTNRRDFFHETLNG